MYTRRFICCALIFMLALIVNGCGQSIAQNTRTHATKVGQNQYIAKPVYPSLARPMPGDIGSPVRLLIPSININAAIEPVGIRSNGEMDTPAQNPWTGVGWYNAGPRPGERGSAVVDGHLDRPGGSPAVFWSLNHIRVGSEVTVTTTIGKMLHFHVTRIAFYAPQNAPLQGIFGDTGGYYLNLITCAGDWMPEQHQTTLRLVVYTTLE